MASSSVIETKKTQTQSIADEKGNMKLASETFFIEAAVIQAGTNKDESGREFSWERSVRVIVPGKKGPMVLKLDASQALWLQKFFSLPEVAAELNKWKLEEFARMRADMEASL